MINTNNYPSPQKLLIETPLYEVVRYEDADLELGRQVVYFDEVFDSYCPECNSHSIFQRSWGGKKYISYNPAGWVNSGEFLVEIECTRDRKNK